MVDDSYRGYRNDPYGRGGTGSSEPANDPLTELARLIGQSDPFGERNRRADAHGADDWRNNQQPAYPDENAGHADHYGTAAGHEQYTEHGGQAGYDGANAYDANGADPYAANGADHYAASGTDQAYAGYSQQDAAGYADPHGYGDAPYQQEPQPHYADGGAYYDPSQQNGPPNLGPPPHFGDPHAGRPDAYYGEPPAQRRRSWLITVAALVGLAVLGTAGAFAYRSVVAGGPPPLITRDVRPDKVVPPVPNADANKQPDRLAAGANEQMAPPPEQPINVAVASPPATPNAASAAPALPLMTPGIATQAAPPAQPPAAAPTAPAGTGNPVAPRKIHTVKISADEPGGAVAPPQSIVPRAVPPRAAAPAPRDANAPLSLAPQSVPDQPSPPARNVAPAATRTTALAPAPAPARTEAAGGPGYYVQVGAYKSQEEARTSYHSIEAKYASVLHGHAPVFRRKDLGAKGVFYGAQVGPFSHEGAIHLCEQLKSAGGSCMIQRN